MNSRTLAALVFHGIEKKKRKQWEKSREMALYFASLVNVGGTGDFKPDVECAKWTHRRKLFALKCLWCPTEIWQ